jgi:hypothetical protein
VNTGRTRWRMTEFGSRLLAAAAAALALGWLQPAAAEPLGESLSGQAAQDYNSGRLLYDDQDYAGASLKFQRAYEQSNDPRLLWNAAASEKNLRHYANVLRLLERYIAEAQDRMPAAQRREVDDVIRTVRLLISTVRITVDQPGVAISIDGAAAGKSPLSEPLWVDLGRRELLLHKAGFQDQRIVREFAGGSEVNLNLHMQAEVKDGRVNVFAARGQSIRIDSRIVGEGQWSGSLPQGEHVLRVTAEDMRPFQQEISVVAGQTRTLHVALEREARGVSAWVWVGAGAVVLGGLVTGGYFLLRPPSKGEPLEGSLGAPVEL